MQHVARNGWIVSTVAIVACNFARNVAGVEASSTSATFHATFALCVCLLQHCTQWCDVTKSSQPIRFPCFAQLGSHAIYVARNVAACVLPSLHSRTQYCTQCFIVCPVFSLYFCCHNFQQVFFCPDCSPKSERQVACDRCVCDSVRGHKGS